MRVLLVEDDKVLGQAIRDQIAADGHGVDWIQRLDAAASYMAGTSYQLILLDLMLPDGRGQDFLRRLRRSGNDTPVIILSALDQLAERIEGLNAGADDYLVKPFDLDELSARLSAVARRYSGNPNPLVNLGDIQIDLSTRTVWRTGQALALTSREWILLDLLAQRPGQLLSRRQLEDSLYSYDTEIESNAIEVHISHLRKKLGREHIETVRGMGYRLVAPS